MATAFSLAAVWLPQLAVLVLALDLLLLAAFLFDLVRTPSPEGLAAERVLPATVGLSRPLERVVRIDPARARGLLLELDEEFPPNFEVTRRTLPGRDGTANHAALPMEGHPAGGSDRVRLPETGSVELRREYLPRVRGEHVLGDVRVRLRGPWGLVERQAKLPGRQVVQVEPPLLHLSRTLQLAASERWRDLGVRTVRKRGGMVEFESLRDYVVGDDVRAVDWKAFARRGKPTVRQYQDERGQELLLVIDTGRRMRAVAAEGELAGWTKLDWALDAALELAAVALQKGDRVGIVAFDRRLRAFVAPARGARQLARLRRAVFHLQPSEVESDLERALREIAARHPRRALLAVLSDVADLYSIQDQRRSLAAASQRHRVIFAALDDPDLRRVAEGDERSASDPALRATACELVEDRRRSLRRLASARIRVLDALPAEAAGPLLAAWLEERRFARG